MSVLAGGRSPVRRRRWAVTAVAAVAALLVGCGQASSPSPTVTHQDDIAAAKQAPPTPVLPTTWPLTGVAVDGTLPNRPALVVKIENIREVRPQTGLDQADLVWEEVVEGGITRFLAVFHSQVPASVGPVRSVRPMDPRIAGPLHGLIAFSGGQAQYQAALKSAGLQLFSFDAGDEGFARKSGIAAPHNVFGTPSTWWAAADSDHQSNPPEQFAHARTLAQATAVTAGTAASSVALTMTSYAQPSWTWDAGSGTWLRSEGSTPAKAASGARLAAANVVVLTVQVVNTSGVDPAGNPIPDTKLEGTGTGLVATGGKTLQVTWTKSSDSDPVSLTTADGSAVKLAPGVTWVELVPTTGTVTVR